MLLLCKPHKGNASPRALGSAGLCLIRSGAADLVWDCFNWITCGFWIKVAHHQTEEQFPLSSFRVWRWQMIRPSKESLYKSPKQSWKYQCFSPVETHVSLNQSQDTVNCNLLPCHILQIVVHHDSIRLLNHLLHFYTTFLSSQGSEQRHF